MRKIKILSGILIGFIAICFIGYVIHERENVFTGILKIITSPSVLITDFLVIGGIGASFVNAFLIFLFNFTIIKILKIEINDIHSAGKFAISVFDFLFCLFALCAFYLFSVRFVFYHQDFSLSTLRFCNFHFRLCFYLIWLIRIDHFVFFMYYYHSS